ncbi:MAG: hypothetical protein ABJP70_02660 [Erythrobacter sp.]
MLKLNTALLAFVTLAAAPVAAQDAQPSEGQQTAEIAPFASAEPIEETKLAKIAGREDVNQVIQSDQQNNVGSNSVGDNSETGTITLRDNAFANLNGFTILNANTGNNVAINSSIQVNVALPSQ